MAEVYLLRVKDSGRVVAEAKLEIHDPAATWRLFQNAFGSLLATIPGGIYQVMLIACDPEKLAKFPQGLAAISIEGGSSPIIIPRMNGNMGKK